MTADALFSLKGKTALVTGASYGFHDGTHPGGRRWALGHCRRGRMPESVSDIFAAVVANDLGKRIAAAT